MNPDFLDLLREFSAAEVRFLIVGAYAEALAPSLALAVGRWSIHGQMQVDSSATNEPFQLRRAAGGDWLMVGMVPPKRGGLELLEPLVHVRVLVLREDQEQLWCGTVVQRTDSGVLPRLWGSSKLLGVAFSSVLRAGVVPVHTHREHVAVCDLQRRGEPARVCTERKYVELDDEMYARVEAYAEARGVALSEGLSGLLVLALGRREALGRYAAKIARRTQDRRGGRKAC